MRAAVHVFQIYRVAGDTTVWWRLVSANGRAIARSAEPAASPQEAQAAITRLNGALDEVVARVRPTEDGRWRWSLDLDGATVVVGVGDHDRRVRCEYAWRRFVLSAPLAVVSSTAHSFHRAGSSSISPWSTQPRAARPDASPPPAPFASAALTVLPAGSALPAPSAPPEPSTPARGLFVELTGQGAG